MLVLGIRDMETWATRNWAVLDMLKKVEQYAHAREAGDCECSEPVNNQLRELVLSKMDNGLDWQGMLSLCQFKKDVVVVQAGAICDNTEKAILTSNRSKLRSTMRMLGISEVTGHWQYGQCQVAEQFKVLHRLHHVLSVAKIILKHKHFQVLKTIFLACCIARSASSTRLYACFFIRAQESSLRKSKSEGVRRIISMQRNVNDYALGTPGNPGSFKISYDEKESAISDIKMDGSVAPRLIVAMDVELVQRFFWQHSEISETEKNTWSTIFKVLHEFFKNYHRRKILLTQRLINFRGGGDSFSVKWDEFTGRD
jgi:hypothetical protein